MHASKQDTPMWRRSSYSGDGNNCVEVASVPVGVGVRDSKDPGAGVVLVTPAQWRMLSARVRAGDLDL